MIEHCLNCYGKKYLDEGKTGKYFNGYFNSCVKMGIPFLSIFLLKITPWGGGRWVAYKSCEMVLKTRKQ